jgi:hypothetical protein
LFYFNPENSEGNIQFITLSNIKEKYIWNIINILRKSYHVSSYK